MNDLDVPPGWRQVHTHRFERCDGAVVKRDNQAKREQWVVEIDGLLRANAYPTALEAIAAADVARPIGQSIANVILGSCESTWNTAIDTVVKVLNNMANEMDSGELPYCCPMCALRGAANIFSQGKQNQSGMAKLFAEPAGHA